MSEYELHLIVEALGKLKTYYEKNEDRKDPKIDHKLDRIAMLKEDLEDVLLEVRSDVENTIKYM